MALLRLALAQINARVGDISGNARMILESSAAAADAGADIVAFPELAISGYPPEDLIQKAHFLRECREALDAIAAEAPDICLIIGFPERISGAAPANSAALIRGGKVEGIYRKQFLPNYGVFDEVRYFSRGTESPVFDIKGTPVGLTVCQDIWEEKGPAFTEAAAGAKLIVNINASPYHAGKGLEREMVLRDRAAETNSVIAYVNLVGGQDELVFDGQSLVVRPDGSLANRGAQFAEGLVITDIDAESGTAEAITESEAPIGEMAEIYSALQMGVKDYLGKNGFKTAVIGMSGGIDSALAASIASDALGRDNVKTVFMPTRFSSEDSREDAREIAENLGVEFRELDIDGIFEEYLERLRPFFGTLPFGVAEENLQARIRGNILMGLANKFGWMVLATGNKSEMAVGYATLYGDMAGGFEVIKDIPKTLVYKLADFRNSVGHVIPDGVIRKAPTAELRPDQKDSDSLPPYDILDPIINFYVEQDMSVEEIVDRGFERATVEKVASLIDRNEYKRRQAPPGIKITPKAFGKDRRLPITNLYRG